MENNKLEDERGKEREKRPKGGTEEKGQREGKRRKRAEGENSRKDRRASPAWPPKAHSEPLHLTSRTFRPFYSRHPDTLVSSSFSFALVFTFFALSLSSILLLRLSFRFCLFYLFFPLIAIRIAFSFFHNFVIILYSGLLFLF